MKSEWGDLFSNFDMDIRDGDNVRVESGSTGHRVNVNR